MLSSQNGEIDELLQRIATLRTTHAANIAELDRVEQQSKDAVKESTALYAKVWHGRGWR